MNSDVIICPENQTHPFGVLQVWNVLNEKTIDDTSEAEIQKLRNV